MKYVPHGLLSQSSYLYPVKEMFCVSKLKQESRNIHNILFLNNWTGFPRLWFSQEQVRNMIKSSLGPMRQDILGFISYTGVQASSKDISSF